MDLSLIEGEELNSVVFVMDYVQFTFNGPWMTLYIWPEVFVPAGAQLSQGSYAYGDPGYRDAMCLQIGETVETVTAEEGIALEIKFENGTIFRTSLREEDFEGPEAVNFSSGVLGEPLMVF